MSDYIYSETCVREPSLRLTLNSGWCGKSCLSYKGTCHVILLAKLHDMHLYKITSFPHQPLKSTSKVALFYTGFTLSNICKCNLRKIVTVNSQFSSFFLFIYLFFLFYLFIIIIIYFFVFFVFGFRQLTVNSQFKVFWLLSVDCKYPLPYYK